MKDQNIMEVKLTEYAKNAGCGCKLGPETLKEILPEIQAENFPGLIRGNENSEDCAVFDLGENYLLSTTDFFTPVVDDPEDFAAVAVANALSDIYAMGGKPILALAILGWPVGKIPSEIAKQILKKAQEICAKFGVPLAGGHSIESTEPIFGLSVNGIVPMENLKSNGDAIDGDLLYCTKPLGFGIGATALKRGLLREEAYTEMIVHMKKVNSIGEKLGEKPYVHAMTDITGFGLLGHLKEMCWGSSWDAEIYWDKIPKLSFVDELLAQMIYPDITTKNYSAVAEHVNELQGDQLLLLCDPQTSGGLLVAVDPAYQYEFEGFMRENKEMCVEIGKIFSEGEKMITVR